MNDEITILEDLLANPETLDHSTWSLELGIDIVAAIADLLA
jgi:hypothetical protein